MTSQDPLYGTVIFFAFAIGGVIAIMIGRTMATADEESWKEGWREWFSGPPGYHRAATILLGIVLMIVGSVGVIVGAVRSLFY